MPYGNNDGGYRYTADALNGIVGQLREGAKALDGVASRAVNGVDAGFSSAAVGAALAGVVKLATAGAGVMDGSADRVHSANGSYDQIENDHAGQLKLNEQRDTPESRLQDGVHG